MIYRIIFVASLTVLASACQTHKKTQSAEDVSVIQLDTIQVGSKEQSKNEIYRSSNTMLSDILHTKLEVNFDWKLCRMNGKATIDVKPYFYPTTFLYLNARGMDIKTINVFTMESVVSKDPATSDGTEILAPGTKLNSTSYVYENDSLKISLGRNFTAMEKYRVVIEYVAKPNELKSAGGSNAITDDKGLYFVNPTGENIFKMPQVWTQGETQASSVWFPTIDSPNEKMTQEILMTVDDKYTTLSNGSLISSVKQDKGMRLDHWKLDQPHSPYLAMMAVGEFKKVVGESYNGKEVSYYVEPLYEPYAKEIFGDTKEMIQFYSDKLGVPYAWPKYAQVVARDYVSGAMENTSATLHGDFMVYQTSREMIDGKKGNSVIAHELFHQWFGDLVTCESWSNLSLNESFATYGEYLWEEYKLGRDAADYHHWQSKQGYLNAGKEVDIIRFNYHDKEDMFDAFSYNKGGQIIHMLRKAVGDDAFFASLKNYLETNKYKAAEIHNLRLAFEETTGRDMNWFFNQWYLNNGRPALKIRILPNEGKDTVKLLIEQTQDLKKFPLYTLPIEVDLYTGKSKERKHIVISEQSQTFVFPVAGNVELVNVDAERQLLADIDYPKTLRQYVYQYNNAPLFEDRYEALTQLSTNLKEDIAFVTLQQAAGRDKFFAIRHYAMQQLEKADDTRKAEVKALFLNLYSVEKNSLTRAKLLAALNRMTSNPEEMKGLNLEALNEKSYAVCSEGLMGIAKLDPKLAMEKAIRFENEGGKEILFVIANLYANHGGDGQIHFYHGALKYIMGFDLMGFSGLYAKAARQCTVPENAINAAKDLEMVANGANKYVKYSAKKGVKDILSTWESRENTLVVKIENAKKENASTSNFELQLQQIKNTKTQLYDIYNRIK